MIGAFAAVVAIMIGVSVAVIDQNSEPTKVVEVGDTIDIEYTLWLSNHDGDKIDRLQTGDFQVTVGETAKDTGDSGLIYGFWDALIGMVEDVPEYAWLNKCIDDCQARPAGVVIDDEAEPNDNWDDRWPPYPPYGRRAESYGADNTVTSESTGESYNLRFTPILFRIEVVNIEKETTGS